MRKRIKTKRPKPDSDRFFAVYRRILGGDTTNQHRRREDAEKRARELAEREPQHQFFVMLTVVRFAAEKPEIVRTEVEP